MRLEVKAGRDVDLDEVKGMIWGTGALTWSWWGKVTDNGDGSFTFRHDGPDSSGEGVHDKLTVVTAEAIVVAASVWLSEMVRLGYGDIGDIRDAITDDLGYLDAGEADCVLQIAVFATPTPIFG